MCASSLSYIDTPREKHSPIRKQSYWSKQDGNYTLTWADAHLTEEGIKQARIANKFWASEMATQRIPVPEKYYTSPLHRCLDTANTTFNGLQLPAQQPFIPEVKELLREVIGIHSCDRRSSRTYIHTSFPSYRIEPGFAEEDQLWRPDVRENHSVHDVRILPIAISCKSWKFAISEAFQFSTYALTLAILTLDYHLDSHEEAA